MTPRESSLRRSLLWAARLPLAAARRGGFRFGGERLAYIHHAYNFTWANERCVEVPIARAFLARRPEGRRLEVGNVLAHYGVRGAHVVDRYERGPGVENVDVLAHRPAAPYDTIVTISTLEHVGWDETPRDPARAEAAFHHLRALLAPGGALLATVPLGYHPRLDAWLASREPGSAGFAVRFLRRAGLRWAPAGTAEVRGARYRERLHAADAIAVVAAEG